MIAGERSTPARSTAISTCSTWRAAARCSGSSSTARSPVRPPSWTGWSWSGRRRECCTVSGPRGSDRHGRRLTMTRPTSKRKPASATTSSPTIRRSRPGSRPTCPTPRPPWTRRPSPDTPLGLYLHIPFCRKRCKFCYFRVYTDKNARDVETYLDALVKEVELYSRLPVVGGRPLQLRLLRRRHAVVPERRRSSRPDRPAARRSCPGTGPRK